MRLAKKNFNDVAIKDVLEMESMICRYIQSFAAKRNMVIKEVIAEINTDNKMKSNIFINRSQKGMTALLELLQEEVMNCGISKVTIHTNPHNGKITVSTSIITTLKDKER